MPLRAHIHLAIRLSGASSDRRSCYSSLFFAQGDTYLHYTVRGKEMTQSVKPVKSHTLHFSGVLTALHREGTKRPRTREECRPLLSTSAGHRDWHHCLFATSPTSQPARTSNERRDQVACDGSVERAMIHRFVRRPPKETRPRPTSRSSRKRPSPREGRILIQVPPPVLSQELSAADPPRVTLHPHRLKQSTIPKKYPPGQAVPDNG